MCDHEKEKPLNAYEQKLARRRERLEAAAARKRGDVEHLEEQLMHTLYTMGYAQWSHATLHAELQRLNALLVDIRYNPTSMRPEWRKQALQSVFGAVYQHMPALGNKNYQGGSIVLAHAAAGLAQLRTLLAQRPVLLLCQCADWRLCHRSMVASLAAHEFGCEVYHLDPPVRAAPAGWIKVLTVRQPWAWALMYGGKDIENRTWPTRYEGTLGIHAAKGMTKQEYRVAQSFCASRGLALPAPQVLVYGAMLGTVTMVDCVDVHHSPWFEGPWGFVLQHAQPFVSPIQGVSGQLGLWEWENVYETR